MNCFFRKISYSLKLDVVRIFVLLNVADFYCDYKQMTNGLLFAYLDLLLNEAVQKKILRKLETKKRVVLDFRCSKEGEKYFLYFDVYGVGNWEELAIEGLSGNDNGLCIIHQYEDNRIYSSYSESELKSIFVKAIKCKTREILND
jgi:hypothetical protein